ncbi:MAG TPA: RidA family protein [Gemmatimonadales bacterium]|jgi:enamine deaminase RidA (YjgF/YER057c/UK114 family)
MSESVLPPGWVRPSGYANAIIARGRVIALAGQVGWNPRTLQIESTDFVHQVRQALRNIVDVLRAAQVTPAEVVRLTWYITDRDAYQRNLAEIGRAYREVFGSHYPAMTLVIVAGLLEPAAKIEIEATAVVP